MKNATASIQCHDQADIDSDFLSAALRGLTGSNDFLPCHLFDGYASSVMNVSCQYSMIEVRGVRFSTNGEVVEDNERPEFFSCYAREKKGQAQCIGDFGFLPWAMSYAAEISEEKGAIEVVCMVGGQESLK